MSEITGLDVIGLYIFIKVSMVSMLIFKKIELNSKINYHSKIYLTIFSCQTETSSITL